MSPGFLFLGQFAHLVEIDALGFPVQARRGSPDSFFPVKLTPAPWVQVPAGGQVHAHGLAG